MWAAPAGAEAPCHNEDGCVRVLRVSGLVDPVVIEFVEREVDAVRADAGYVATILEVNSEGASVDDAELTRFVRHLREAEVPVSAWVGTSAVALGAAAELVVALPDSAMAALSRIGEVERVRLPGDLLGDATEELERLSDRTISAGRAKDLGLVAAACGGSDGGDDSSAPDTSAVDAGGDTTAAVVDSSDAGAATTTSPA